MGSLKNWFGGVVGLGVGAAFLWNVAVNDPEETRENFESIGKNTVSSGAGLVDGVITGLSEESKKILEDIGLDPEHTTPSDIADKISDKSGKISDGTKEFLGRLLENSGIELPSFETNSCDSETYYRNPDCF